MTLRPAFEYLKAVAFYDIPLPKRVTLKSKRLKDAYGYYYSDPHTIEIDSTIPSEIKRLKVMAHEMCHASLEQAAACDHHDHDENFRQLAKIVCERMGWSMRGF